MNPSFLFGAIVGSIFGFFVAHAIAFIRDFVEGRKDPSMLSGAHLRAVAFYFYGIRKRLGESDRSLRRRCAAKLEVLFP